MTPLLTRHFTWLEVIHSPTADRLHIDNSLPISLRANAIFTAQQMEMVRAELDRPIKVNSWFRSRELNRAVGGSLTSVHMRALAVDFKPVGMELMEAFVRLMALDIPFDQLIHEGTKDGADWIHIGFSNDTPRREVLAAMGDVLGGPMTFTRVATG